MLIKIGGDVSEVPDGLSIQDLVRSKSLPDGTIVELNGEIIRAERWAGTKLNQNDDLEFIQLVLGG